MVTDAQGGECDARSAYAGNNSSDDQSNHFYWKREALPPTGLFKSSPDGIRAPRCYQIDEQPGSAHWMEDVREDVGAIWPLSHYGQVSRHFGRMNGLYLEQRPPALALAHEKLFYWLGLTNPIGRNSARAIHHCVWTICWSSAVGAMNLSMSLIGLWNDRGFCRCPGTTAANVAP